MREGKTEMPTLLSILQACVRPAPLARFGMKGRFEKQYGRIVKKAISFQCSFTEN
jgi:hypothetical protein